MDIGLVKRFTGFHYSFRHYAESPAGDPAETQKFLLLITYDLMDIDLVKDFRISLQFRHYAESLRRLG